MNILKDKRKHFILFSLILMNLLILSPHIAFSEPVDFNSQEVELEAHTRSQGKTVIYKDFGEIKPYYMYNDGFYVGPLKLHSRRQNGPDYNYSWTAYYYGDVTSNMPIESWSKIIIGKGWLYE